MGCRDKRCDNRPPESKPATPGAAPPATDQPSGILRAPAEQRLFAAGCETRGTTPEERTAPRRAKGDAAPTIFPRGAARRKAPPIPAAKPLNLRGAAP